MARALPGRALWAAAAALLVAGCASKSAPSVLESRSLGPTPVVLDAEFDTVVYTHDPDGDTSFFLTDIPVDDLLSGRAIAGQILHIDMLWEPKAGYTPMDPTATNTSIRQVIVATGGDVGLYVGAGFAEPKQLPGVRRLDMAVYNTTLRLLESTEGFVDPLTPAQVTGTFTAKLDDRLARRLHRAMSQFVTNTFGRTMFVSADADAIGDEATP